ncbi:hypothetical protein VAEU17_240102 [Vibrio aestuarianus]|nr:hypothetical protein VAEU17_240102 [Vibrio aestuarianus]
MLKIMILRSEIETRFLVLSAGAFAAVGRLFCWPRCFKLEEREDRDEEAKSLRKRDDMLTTLQKCK